MGEPRQVIILEVGEHRVTYDTDVPHEPNIILKGVHKDDWPKITDSRLIWIPKTSLQWTHTNKACFCYSTRPILMGELDFRAEYLAVLRYLIFMRDL